MSETRAPGTEPGVGRAPTLQVIVNGRPETAPAGASVAGLLASLGLDPRRVAVERNRDIVPRSALHAVMVEADDRFEIVEFVGGG